MRALFAIARTTFSEVTRQPGSALILLGALLGYCLSPYLAMFALRDDANLLKDFGVATIFLAGIVLAGFWGATLSGREKERSVIATILSKPISRGSFLLGRLTGILGALAAAVLLFTLALLMAARQGPPRSVHQPVDWPAVAGGWGAFLLTSALSTLSCLRQGRRFGSEVVRYGLVLYPALTALVAFFDRDWLFQPAGLGYDGLVCRAALLVLFGVMLVGAVAVVLSHLMRRGAVVLTLLLAGGGLALNGESGWWLCFLPYLQAFWAGELFYRPGSELPEAYLALGGLYALAYSLAWVSLGLWRLQRAEAG